MLLYSVILEAEGKDSMSCKTCVITVRLPGWGSLIPILLYLFPEVQRVLPVLSRINTGLGNEVADRAEPTARASCPPCDTASGGSALLVSHHAPRCWLGPQTEQEARTGRCERARWPGTATPF